MEHIPTFYEGGDKERMFMKALSLFSTSNKGFRQ
jgi:hypothetical protein